MKLNYFDMVAIDATVIFEHSWGYEFVDKGPLLPVMTINLLFKHIKII